MAAIVSTIPQAVEISLREGVSERTLFEFARALKAFEVTTGARLSPNDLGSAFALWWSTAKSLLPPDADFDEYRFTFDEAFEKARSPLGGNLLQEATRCADTQPLPAAADRYASPGIRRLVGVCCHLQRLQGSSPIIMSVRNAAEIAGKKRPEQGSNLLAGLVRDGILTEVERGAPGGNRASRYRFTARNPKDGGLPAQARAFR